MEKKYKKERDEESRERNKNFIYETGDEIKDESKRRWKRVNKKILLSVLAVSLVRFNLYTKAYFFVCILLHSPASDIVNYRVYRTSSKKKKALENVFAPLK